MTPREKIEQRAIDYSVEHPSEAPQLDELHFKDGAEYGYNLALESVCEYLKFFINVPDEVETNENGEPLATSFLEVSMKRIKAAEEFTNNLKQAMKL